MTEEGLPNEFRAGRSTLGQGTEWEVPAGSQSHCVVAVCGHSSLDDLLRTGTTFMLRTSQRTNPRYLRLMLGVLGPLEIAPGWAAV